MCGIFGAVINNHSSFIDKDKCKNAAVLMKHRGPDAYGQWGIAGKIELTHLRLSIIDLSPESSQPFFSNCRNFVIVFNGEIYNYIEIRQELKSLGHHFRTASDTEVLLNAYIEWGEKCVAKFNGDWAFSIYDIRNNTLFCSRDRFGVKPFNYATANNQFIFSSEIKSILHYYPNLRCPNYNVIANFCRNSLGAQAEDTWFVGVKRLLPAHNLIWKDGKIEIKKYWDYPLHTINISMNEATETYRDIFLNAVKLRMRSDVPIGTTLSSGLDSSSIVSVLRKFYGDNHKTFTAVFNRNDYQRCDKSIYRGDIEIDEGSLVKKLSNELHLDAHLINIPDNNFIGNLTDVIYHLESGHSSPAILPLSKILDYAKDHVTVVMEGQGADELLSGYVINAFPALIWELLKSGNINQTGKEFIEFKKTYSLQYAIKQFIRLLNNDKIEKFYRYKNGIDKVFGPKLKTFERIKDYPMAPPAFDEFFNKELFKSHTGGLVNLLHYGDAISMSKSMESRLPFMDFNLVEFSFQLPYHYKMQNGLGKYIHRVAMQGVVPGYILNNPVKFGFSTPLSRCFDSLNLEANRILLSEKCLERGIFNGNGLKKLVDDHIKKNKNNSTMLFRLLSVELWFRCFIDSLVNSESAN